MSRVYEALRKAEGQHPVEKHSAIELSSVSRDVLPALANHQPAELDPTMAERPQAKPSFFIREQPEQWSSSEPVADIDMNAKCEDALSLPKLPPSRRIRGPLLVIGHTEYPNVAEQFHRLALSLQNWAADNKKHVFTIMSALSQDGKSFVAINLAASLAMGGSRVILVDGDLRQPVLHRPFNMLATRGLIGYIRREVEFSECLQPTPIPGLFLVPAGGTSDTPSELLASSRMRDFIREARSPDHAHYLIMDSPAASLVPEAQILSRLGDASLIVVAANRTPRELVKQTIEIIGDTPVIGIVLNRFEAPYSAIAHYPDRYATERNPGITAQQRLQSGAKQSNTGPKTLRSLITYFRFENRHDAAGIPSSTPYSSGL